MPEIFIITDKETDFLFDNVKVLYFKGDMPHRIKEAFHYIPYEYVILTLDDRYRTGRTA